MSSNLDDSISALSPSTSSFPNPNIRRNHAPGPAELLSLKALAKSFAKAAHVLDEDIMHLRRSHDSIQTRRYVDLQLELAATQSELHEANDLLAAAQGRREALQVKQDDLRALLHPIHRCPHEILGEIFEWAIIGIEICKEITMQSVHLSSVCQHWRNVAINTPRLWSYITFMLDKPPESQKFLRACILPRIKHIPAAVRVRAINGNSSSALSECGLPDIPVIDILALVVSTPGDIQHILGPSFHPPVGTMEALHIRSLPPPHPSMNITNYNILRLVARFPSFHTLEIHGVANPIFPISVTNTNITKLDIFDAGLLDILALLQCFPRLRHMTIGNSVLLNGGMQSAYHFPSIEYIRVTDTTDEDWMRRVFFPNLTTVFCAAASEAFLAFLSRHPSITEVESVPHVDGLMGIVTVAPRLTSLHLVPPLGLFSYLIYKCRHKIFSSLKFLTITACGVPNNLTLADFEAVTSALCLPKRHPRSRATNIASIVSTFAIITMNSARTWGYLDWHESELYKKSTKKIDAENPDKVYLSWPEWE